MSRLRLSTALAPALLAAQLVALIPAAPMPAGPLPPRPLDPEVARILAAGGCVLLDGTPTYPFAEVARDPRTFAGHTIRLHAVLVEGPEGAFLVASSTAGGTRFRVSYAPAKGDARKQRDRALARLRGRECGGKALVGAVGALEGPTHPRGPRFVISRFDAVEPVR